MKPAPFEYARPNTPDEVVALLAEHGDEARVLAGGQSLVPLMNLRLARPEVIVDINRVSSLADIEATDEGLVVGAVARQADVEASQVAATSAPLVVEALHHVAHPQLRNRGTVVGSLAHHDPAAELPAVAVALDAELVLAGPAGQRRVAAADFFTGHFTTALGPDEFVTHAVFPSTETTAGTGFAEIARRPGDFATVAAAAAIGTDGEDIVSASLVLAGVADRPVSCQVAANAVIGQPATPDTMQLLAAQAADDDAIDPHDDVHATAAYRQSMIPIVATRALTAAARMS